MTKLVAAQPHAAPSYRNRSSQGWKATMKISTELTMNFSSTLGKIAVAFALLSAIAGLTASPAFAQYNDGRDRGAQDRGRNDQRDNRYRNDTRGRYDNRDRRGYRPEYQHPYRYSQPVYVPPT